jgi:putative transposase
VGHTPILKAWWPREHLSAISAMSPEGTLSLHGQAQAIKAADVVAFLEHVRREVPGRMGSLWDGAPLHRRQLIQEFLANGAAPRLPMERLPA